MSPDGPSVARESPLGRDPCLRSERELDDGQAGTLGSRSRAEASGSLGAPEPVPNLRREHSQETGQEQSEKREFDDQPGRAVRSSSTKTKRQEQRHQAQKYPATTERAKDAEASGDKPHRFRSYAANGSRSPSEGWLSERRQAGLRQCSEMSPERLRPSLRYGPMLLAWNSKFRPRARWSDSSHSREPMDVNAASSSATIS
jgi:hypothetical protein